MKHPVKLRVKINPGARVNLRRHQSRKDSISLETLGTPIKNELMKDGRLSLDHLQQYNESMSLMHQLNE
jgi:hypothetical protein